MKKMTHIIRAATTHAGGAAGSSGKVLEPSSASLSTYPEVPTSYTCHGGCQVESTTCGARANRDRHPNSSPSIPYVVQFAFDDRVGMRISAELWQDFPGALTARVAVHQRNAEPNIYFFRLPIADRADPCRVLRTLADRLTTAIPLGHEDLKRVKEEETR